MFGNKFLHPDHVIPSAEFISAFVKFTDHTVTKMFMEGGTVFGEIFVFNVRVADTGI